MGTQYSVGGELALLGHLQELEIIDWLMTDCLSCVAPLVDAVSGGAYFLRVATILPPMYLEKLKPDGKIAVVTGGGRAIGFACSNALAESGAKVVIADVDPAVATSGVAQARA